MHTVQYDKIQYLLSHDSNHTIKVPSSLCTHSIEIEEAQLRLPLFLSSHSAVRCGYLLEGDSVHDSHV